MCDTKVLTLKEALVNKRSEVLSIFLQLRDKIGENNVNTENVTVIEHKEKQRYNSIGGNILITCYEVQVKKGKYDENKSNVIDDILNNKILGNATSIREIYTNIEIFIYDYCDDSTHEFRCASVKDREDNYSDSYLLNFEKSDIPIDKLLFNKFMYYVNKEKYPCDKIFHMSDKYLVNSLYKRGTISCLKDTSLDDDNDITDNSYFIPRCAIFYFLTIVDDEIKKMLSKNVQPGYFNFDITQRVTYEQEQTNKRRISILNNLFGIQ